MSRLLELAGGQAARLSLDLSASKGWTLRVSAKGYWSESVQIPPGPLRTDPVTAELWPAEAVSGRVVLRAKGQTPSEVLFRFQRHPVTPEPASELVGAITCPVRDGTWSCEAPTGLLDFSVRVSRHVSHYFWGQRLDKGRAIFLGRMEFLPGASLVGRLMIADKEATVEKARVSLHPVSPRGGAVTGHTLAPIAVGVNPRGFFHFGSIAPGSYSVVASYPGFVNATENVLILDGAEAPLRKPLTLEKPRKLSFIVSPAKDPTGLPWDVELIEIDSSGVANRLGSGPTGIDGSWTYERGVASRSYMLRVRASNLDLWHGDTTPFVLDPGDPPHRVEIQMETVRGTVSLAKRPVRANLTFGTETGPLSIHLRSSEDGAFQGLVPHLGHWRVSVVSEVPPIRRIVEIDVSGSGTETANADIALPQDSLEGEIVGPEGTAIAKALLHVRRRMVQESVAHRVEGGTFSLSGLSDGDYELDAEAPGMESDTQSVTLHDGTPDPPFVRLEVRRPPSRGVSCRPPEAVSSGRESS